MFSFAFFVSASLSLWPCLSSPKQSHRAPTLRQVLPEAMPALHLADAEVRCFGALRKYQKIQSTPMIIDARKSSFEIS